MVRKADAPRLGAAAAADGQANYPDKVNGTGVNPMGTNNRLAQPKMVRPVPSGTLSLAVGGWMGPMSTNRNIINIQPQ